MYQLARRCSAALLLILLSAAPAWTQQTFVNQYGLATDATFQKRVEMAIVTASIAVKNEDPGTANHAARVILATKILGSPVTSAVQMAVGVVTNPAIQVTATTNSDGSVSYTTSASDADIQFTVNSQLNAYTNP